MSYYGQVQLSLELYNGHVVQGMVICRFGSYYRAISRLGVRMVKMTYSQKLGRITFNLSLCLQNKLNGPL